MGSGADSWKKWVEGISAYSQELKSDAGNQLLTVSTMIDDLRAKLNPKNPGGSFSVIDTPESRQLEKERKERIQLQIQQKEIEKKNLADLGANLTAQIKKIKAIEKQIAEQVEALKP